MGKRIMAGALIVVSVLFIVITIVKASEPTQTTETTPEEVQSAEHEVEPIQEVVVSEQVKGDSIELYPDEYYADLELLAHLIYSEDAENGEVAMWYTGSVVLNRVNDPNYPNTIYDVIFQRGQYEVTWNGGLYKEEPSDVAYEISAELMQSGGIIPDEVLYSAEFIQHYGVYDKVGHTYYCY